MNWQPFMNKVYLEELLKSKTVQLVTIKVDDYVTREFTWNDFECQRAPD